jgi:divalent metal cation (Fe/Co/Zn/Cd) transporter
MTAITEQRAHIEEALLNSERISRVIKLDFGTSDGEFLVAAKVDLDPDITMREVSFVLHQAKRRVLAAVPEAQLIYIEPDVYIDPNAATPSTSTIDTLSYD